MSAINHNGEVPRAIIATYLFEGTRAAEAFVRANGGEIPTAEIPVELRRGLRRSFRELGLFDREIRTWEAYVYGANGSMVSTQAEVATSLGKGRDIVRGTMSSAMGKLKTPAAAARLRFVLQPQIR
ncbi:hypothetical protein HYS97_01520 [Candidatus Daviesbacteria bacterium]|nr:hypothetical protein [Candidatus Daviesbacteria bacterium]